MTTEPSSVISSLEQGLLNDISTPVQQTLSELPLQQFGVSSPSATTVPSASAIDPLGLITPVINSLSTLGTGQFSGVDPTQILSGISDAIEGNTAPLQKALGTAATAFQGEAGTAANNATTAALANGTAVANQANGIGNILSSAASTVSQARQQLLDIIDGYQGTLAASDLSTAAGKSAVLTAANQANSAGTGIMQELQSSLGSLGSQLSALGEIPTALKTNFSDGLNDISAGVKALGAGNVPDGLNDLLTAPQNLVVDPAENVALGLFAARVGQPLAPNAFEVSPVTSPNLTTLGNTLSGLNQTLMADNQALMTNESSSNPHLASYLATAIGGLNDLLYLAPKDVFINLLGAKVE